MTHEPKIVIVAPTHIQPSDAWIDALAAQNVDVIIVADRDCKINVPESWDVYGYDRQREELGNNLYEESCMFHQSSASRNFGHWIAYKKGYDIIIGVDNDCIVPENFVRRHMEGLAMNGYGWVNPIAKTGWFPRGFPYSQRNKQVVLNMGLWQNKLDLNGLDRMNWPIPEPRLPIADVHAIAVGKIPLSGMNFAVLREAIPGFLFMPTYTNQQGYRFSRHDDIWGGYVLQKLMDKKEHKIAYGTPWVYHDTVVIPEEDAAEEEAMTHYEEQFYKIMDTLLNNVKPDSYDKMFKDFAERAVTLPDDFDGLEKAINFWAKLF